MMDRASWEFTDLRSRMNMLEGREELDTNDVLRPHVLARVVTDAWLTAPLGFDAWRVLQTVLHDELSHFAEEAYHETNRFLLAAQRAARSRPAALHPPLQPWRRRRRRAPAPTGGFGTPTGIAPRAADRLPAAR